MLAAGFLPGELPGAADLGRDDEILTISLSPAGNTGRKLSIKHVHLHGCTGSLFIRGDASGLVGTTLRKGESV